MDAGPDAGPDAGALDAGDPAWAAVLRQAAQSSPLYSLSFGEQSPFLVAIFAVSASPLSCGALPDSSSLSGLLEISTPLGPGTYTLAPPSADIPPAAGQAIVDFRAALDAHDFVSFAPSEGQVVITAAPGDAGAQLAGAHLTGSFHLGFPHDPLQPPECFSGGGVLPDGGIFTIAGWCECKDLEGNTVSICDGGSTEDCCHSTEAATVFVDGTFDAPPCFLLCVDADNSKCEQLWPLQGPDSFPPLSTLAAQLEIDAGLYPSFAAIVMTDATSAETCDDFAASSTTGLEGDQLTILMTQPGAITPGSYAITDGTTFFPTTDVPDGSVALVQVAHPGPTQNPITHSSASGTLNLTSAGPDWSGTFSAVMVDSDGGQSTLSGNFDTTQTCLVPLTTQF